MADETKPVEEVAEVVETPVVETPVVEAAPEAPAAVEEAKTVAKTEEKKTSKPKDIFAAIEGDSEEEAKPKRKMKGAKNVPYGIAFIKTTFNNTIVSLTDMRGQVVSWSSAGRCGFKGSRKSTPFAAQNALADAAKKAADCGMRKVEVKVKGPGPGREAALRALINTGFEVSRIFDVTPIPHNGCKPPKRRRV